VCENSWEGSQKLEVKSQKTARLNNLAVFILIYNRVLLDWQWLLKLPL
jgi:hypothetical protein